MDLKTVLKIMEMQLEIWQKKRYGSKIAKNDWQLIASIVDVQEDIITIKRAIRLQNRYAELTNVKEVV